MFDVQTPIPTHDAAAAAEVAAPAAAAQPSPAAAEQPIALPLRNDTLLGVCEAIGQDFGFNANLLRIALAIGLFWSPVAMVVLYLGLGVAVAVSRWFYPVAGRASVKQAEPGSQDRAEAALPLAA